MNLKPGIYGPFSSEDAMREFADEAHKDGYTWMWGGTPDELECYESGALMFLYSSGKMTLGDEDQRSVWERFHLEDSEKSKNKDPESIHFFSTPQPEGLTLQPPSVTTFSITQQSSNLQDATMTTLRTPHDPSDLDLGRAIECLERAASDPYARSAEIRKALKFLGKESDQNT